MREIGGGNCAQPNIGENGWVESAPGHGAAFYRGTKARVMARPSQMASRQSERDEPAFSVAFSQSPRVASCSVCSPNAENVV